jgi:hypothetical protein
LRGFLSLLVVTGVALIGCQPAPAQPTAPPQQAAPTTAPAKPAEAAKPAATTAPAKPAEAKPAASPATAAKPAEAKPAAGDAAALAEIVQKAGQEREVVAQMSDPLIGSTSEANRAMSDGIKKMFGVDVNVRIDRAPNYPAATAKALSEIKSGGAPSYDLMYQTNLSGLPLLEANAIEKFEWPRLFN